MKKLLLLILLIPSLLFAQGYCENTLININLDQYPSETTWDIQDSLGNVLVSGGPYTNVPNYQPQYINYCLPVGNMAFTIYDLYGDGLQGSIWGGQDGSYYVIQCGDTLVYGGDPAFGYDTTHTFVSDLCPPPPPVPGCTDDDYLEFDPLANIDDGSCATLIVYGCTDSTMYNYDPLANAMDNIAQCTYDLILHDLIGNGWVSGTVLEVYQEDDTTAFFMTNGGFNQAFTIDLYAGEVSAKLIISQQAQFTAVECGFTLIAPDGDTSISVQPPFIQPFVCYEGFTYCGNTCEEKIYGCMDSTAYNYIDTANVSEPCYYYPGCISPAYLEYHVDTTNNYYTDINVQDSCNTLAVFGCTDLTAFNYDTSANVDNGGCLPVVMGCMQPLAFNYNPIANTPDTCIAIVYGCTVPGSFNYDPLANTDDNSCLAIVNGCTDVTAFNYNPLANTDDGSCVPVVLGCTDPTQFNYNQLANVDNGSCLPFIYGCTDSTMYNYDPLANTNNNSCIPFVYGCTNPLAINFNPSANTDDFSCILPIYGCMDSTAFNYNPLANVDNGGCVAIVLGCTNPVALNYNPNANTNDFSCELPIYGCTDSAAFNYNPLANVDNNSCTPFVYGCTDPSALNYNQQANTEDFSCIAYVYGCMDSLALNYDSLANTDNGSCVTVVVGCMDQAAYNYEGNANVNDSISCNYDAGCVTGPGTPYWLNDPCYAWVIDVDNYCCENKWDEVCESMYNYCNNTWTGPMLAREESLVIYPNPTSSTININKSVNAVIYNNLGDVVISKNNTNVLDVSKVSPGAYVLRIEYKDKIIYKKIIKE